MSKKIIFAVLFVITALSAFCLNAFADMGGPIFPEYDVVVSKNGGAAATYDKYDGKTEQSIKRSITIPQSTKLKITGEYYDDNGHLLLMAKYNDKHVEIYSTDVTVVNAAVGKDLAAKTEELIHLIVINKDGAKIYKGPSRAYDTIATIPYNSKIVAEYTYDNENVEFSWCYITYNDISGWIDATQYGYSYDFAQSKEDFPGYTGKVAILEDNLKLSEKPLTEYDYDDNAKDITDYISLSIPVGTELSYDIIYKSVEHIYVYTTYNGVSGWLITANFDSFSPVSTALGQSFDIISMCDTDLKLYSQPFDKGDFIGEYLSAGATAKADMWSRYHLEQSSDNEYDDLETLTSIRLTVNGKTGWLTDKKTYNLSTWNNLTHLASKEIQIYEKPDTASVKLTTIPTFEQYSDFVLVGSEPSEYMYVSYNNKNGWIKNDNDFVKKLSVKLLTMSDNTLNKAVNNGESLVTVPKGTELLTSYQCNTEDGYCYYTEYNGIEGWIYGDIAYLVETETSFNESTLMYSSLEFTEDTVVTIPANERINILYRYYDNKYIDNCYYVEYNGQKGWIRSDKYFNDKTFRIAGESYTAEKANADSSSTSISSRNKLIICCIAAAVMICVFACGMIIFIKKRNDKHNTVID